MRALLIFLVLFGCTQRDTTTTNGRVTSIADGDTFTLLTPAKQQVKVRLYGIDCPEKAQDYGTVARQRLSELIFGQMVRIDTKDIDRYGRTVAIVFNSRGVNVNEEMLKTGLAWHYTQYDQNPAWDDLVTLAQRNNIGLWAKPNPTPPWQWRKKK